MAKIRLTRELLEHLLDLPANVTIIEVERYTPLVDDIEMFTFSVKVAGDTANGPLAIGNDDRVYALQYEETEIGTALVSAIPVPD